MLAKVTVSAPSRLHFGLFSVGDTVSRKFGGIGLMIDSPRVVVHAEQANEFSASGPSSRAVTDTVRCWFDVHRVSIETELGIESLEQLPVKISVESVPPRHAGLGTGTQLACASAMAITRLFELPTPGVNELATSVGRGKRSGIGSYGFCRGGFLVDRGKLPTESLAPLDFQTNFPEPWRILTVIPNVPSGLSGDLEVDAFERLPDSSEHERLEMIEIVRNRIIPGVTQFDYELFASGLFEFGNRSGLMFAEIQDGPYNGATIEALIEQIRDFGIPAVGQSSWGPCVFAVTRNDESAKALKRFLQSQHRDCEINISKADNIGARTTQSGKQHSSHSK